MSIKIYIDQGHNPRDFNTGAEGNGFYEQDITYEVGRRLYALLSTRPEFELKLSRPTSDTILGTSNASSLTTRVRDANAWGADVFLSLHTNASLNERATGSEALIYSKASTIALGLGVLCYGKKWLGFLKFIASAGGGFAIGLAINPMLISTLPVLEGKAWITGAVFALVLGVLSGLLYFVLYIGGSGLFVYVTCYAGGLFPFPLPTEKSVVLSCIAVAVVAFMLLVWRKNSEMLGTAFLGAFLINKGIRIIYDYTALLAEHANVLNAVVLCMIAVLGFTHQYRRRRRYY